MCSDQSPWAVNKNLAYGFAAVSSANTNFCTCYQLTFTSGAISGKKMVVQATNTGSDVGSTQFDLAVSVSIHVPDTFLSKTFQMPGGGFGQFDGCTKEWGATSAVWGAQYGGPTTDTCSQFPTALQPGCSFRWGWFQGTENPTVDYEVATCPAEIVAKSGCSRSGGAVPSNSPSTPVATSAALASSAPAPGSNGTPHESSSAPSSAISPPSSQSTSSTLASVVSSLATGAATEDASPSDLPTAIKSDSMHSGHSTPAYPIGTGLPISHSPHHPHVPHSQTLPPYVHKQGEGQDDDNTCEP